MAEPTPTPPPDYIDSLIERAAAGDAASPPPTRKGDDGRLWEYVDGQWVEAGSQFQKQPVDLSPIYQALSAIGAAPVDMSGSDIPYYLQRPDAYPNANTFALPNGKLYSTDDAMNSLLKLSGLSGGGSGDGVGYANLAQRQAEFAYQQEQDKVALAMGILKELSGQADAFDQRSQYANQNRLAAAGYVVDPSQAYFNGFEPSGYAAKMGLISPQAIQHTSFNPNLPTNPYTAQVTSGLDALRTMA